MNCPGQETSSPFYFTMQGGTQALNPATPLPYDGRFKCYDGWSMLNQVQPAPYNGMYKFPSVTAGIAHRRRQRTAIDPAWLRPGRTHALQRRTRL